MARGISHIYRIVEAVGKQIVLKQIVLVLCQDIRIVRIQKPTSFRVIISALQVVEACFLVIVITTIAEWILEADGVRQAARGGNQFSPTVIHIAYHLVAIAVKNPSDIILEVPDVVIGCSVIQEPNEVFGIIAEKIGVEDVTSTPIF